MNNKTDSEMLNQANVAYLRVCSERNEYQTVLKAVLGFLDQPVTRRLRRQNSVFNADMTVIEHFIKEALAKKVEGA